MSEETFRVYIRRNNNTPSDKSVYVDIGNKTSFKKFMKLSGKKLGIKATRCYVATGGGGHNEIKFLDEIKCNDEVVISEGEPFYSANNTATKGQETMFVSVLGAGGVGKSALTLRFVRDFFVQDWDPTIEDAYRKTVNVDNRLCMLELLDTAGQDDFESLRHQWMQDKHGYIFVYSVLDRQSLDELDQFFDLHKQINSSNHVPIILAANKKDVTDADPKRRKISESEGRKKASQYGATYIETSAATGEHVIDVFESLIREVRRRQSPKTKTAINKCVLL
mmetsp:Transcript_7493/g.12032  ORF Transcript_7493/g.12032 Transcript_7493/m.12032 type:complete len:279 (-) Transcript_7493:348-1184(-)|eukprot:CAMPEP_0203758492 /NCGR_PEP_ID=MMETSP0098-20131031/11335_1 /ASSEMBLY_ACC=CAM_ASM_000208 /TAXON_ID=96639 /ORGANISM=" , Strain NY0313808BC1" /LENGTH=278 /DNA_ID=CAMNT_0050650963 /DNA_START=394 /DNA_END=1230 /DNA_ORIENTATION=+